LAAALYLRLALLLVQGKSQASLMADSLSGLAQALYIRPGGVEPATPVAQLRALPADRPDHPYHDPPPSYTPRPPAPPPPTVEQLMAELNSMIGLGSVKRDVAELVAFLQIQKLREEKGVKGVPTSRHLVFYGNPGTGKTTIARLLSKIYKALGILSRGHFVETDRSGMVGGYVGQTALKVQKVVSEAIGGVLFIDEAYALAGHSNSSNDFGPEAIATLIKLMEDKREDLVVIVAGYPEKMRDFLRSNPGFESRFNRYILFEDYQPSELLEIFELFCQQADYRISDGARDRLLTIFKSSYRRRDENFGNGRYARNIFERAIYLQAARLVSQGEIQDEALFILETEDIPEQNDGF
jgi:stage V sporulation protein K